DPTCVVVESSATWSPLRATGTVSGPRPRPGPWWTWPARRAWSTPTSGCRAPRSCCDPLLFLAANVGLSMRDVVRWVTTQDRPVRVGDKVADGEVQGWLNDLLEEVGSDDEAEEVTLASDALAGVWATDERTRSSIYTTA